MTHEEEAKLFHRLVVIALSNIVILDTMVKEQSVEPKLFAQKLEAAIRQARRLLGYSVITKEEIETIRPGMKLIFIRRGDTLSTDKWNVFTFAGWESNSLWQCQELLDIYNVEHSFSIYDVEIFDPAIHLIHKIMTPEIIKQEQEDFIRKYGE